jgi:lysophospholipase L1-like esterase
VLFVPLWQATYDAQMAIETMPDGIHPNAAGHEVIYNKMKKIMEKML